jgi:hypothetical protein
MLESLVWIKYEKMEMRVRANKRLFGRAHATMTLCQYSGDIEGQSLPSGPDID